MFRRVSIVIAVVVTVLTGYAIMLAFFPSPEASVQRYFDALGGRNLNAAEDELTDELRQKNQRVFSSMWQALSDPRFQPPRAVRTGGWQSAPTAEGERVVAVQYDLGTTTHHSLIKLRRTGGDWKITNGMGTLDLRFTNILLNGQDVESGNGLTLLPGIYELSVNPAALMLTAPPVTVVVTPESAQTVRMSTALKANALDKVRGRLDTIFRACETPVNIGSAECPYQSLDTTGLQKVERTLVTMPEVVIEQTGTETVVVTGRGPGLVRVHAVDANGVAIDRVDSFSLNGKCLDKVPTISCTFSG